MLFEVTFEVLEIYEWGATGKHYLRGSKRSIEWKVERFKAKSKRYEMLGKNGMVVWV